MIAQAMGWLLSRAWGAGGLLLEAMALKMAIGLRGLEAAATVVGDALVRGDLPEARRLVRWHLVSRETSDLDEARVSAATIESVAENASDGVVGPLLYYALFGLPGALVYRYVNTCDSMLGYRDAAREWLGKVPARLDDLVNLLPARLTAYLLIAAARLGGADARRAQEVRRRDARTTASPNAGHPMSAMAGALGVELEKRGHYVLGQGQRLPVGTDIARSVQLMRTAAAIAAGCLLLLGLVAGRPRRR
jgi:adenosylcobinamide-phosphate synthase